MSDARDSRLIESGARCAAAFILGMLGQGPGEGRRFAEQAVAEVLSDFPRIRDDIDAALAALTTTGEPVSVEQRAALGAQLLNALGMTADGVGHSEHIGPDAPWTTDAVLGMPKGFYKHVMSLVDFHLAALAAARDAAERAYALLDRWRGTVSTDHGCAPDVAVLIGDTDALQCGIRALRPAAREGGGGC
jgi:hypothetical protein